MFKIKMLSQFTTYKRENKMHAGSYYGYLIMNKCRQLFEHKITYLIFPIT